MEAPLHPLPDAADPLFQAGLARLLAARYGLPLDSLRVQVLGRVLCKLLARLDRWREGRYISETVQIGPDGQVHTDDWID